MIISYFKLEEMARLKQIWPGRQNHRSSKHVFCWPPQIVLLGSAQKFGEMLDEVYGAKDYVSVEIGLSS